MKKIKKLLSERASEILPDDQGGKTKYPAGTRHRRKGGRPLLRPRRRTDRTQSPKERGHRILRGRRRRSFSPSVCFSPW